MRADMENLARGSCFCHPAYEDANKYFAVHCNIAKCIEIHHADSSSLACLSSQMETDRIV
jgi:hypothetical protein